ncbi:MAG: DUF1800 domain-containing protein [Chitinophagaceae bacterium]|nr:DUF1800 domain-containing protein [Chitinophagaceae bacterium]
MNRRDFLGIKKEKSVVTQKHQSRLISSGLKPYSGSWTPNEVSHLLKRTMFGATLQDVNYFLKKTVSASVDELLNPSTPLPAAPLKNYVNDTIVATDPEYTVANGATWVNTYTADGTANSRRLNSLRSWWMGLIINQDRSIREKLTLFWHNHFSTEAAEISSAIYNYNHNNLLRKSSLGNFKTLVKDVTLSPAMLVYLNGQLNSKTAPDENYSRELQELFTLGKANNPNYTEDDVKTAAKVLTGWRIDATKGSSYFDSTRHDTTNKTFSSFYKNTVIAGKTGSTAGNAELDDLLNMIFANQEEVSLFMVQKLYRWFVYYEIDATTQTNVIEPLAKIFRDSNWEIKPVLSALFKSEHFFDVLNQGCQIKSPLDFICGLCREFNIVFPASTDLIAQYAHWYYMYSLSSNLQQRITEPPDVSGWKAYYQEPMFYEIWINSDTYPKRNQYSDQLVYSGYTSNSKKIIIDCIAFAKALTNPSDPNVLITETLQILYRMRLSQNAKDQIKKDILLSGQTNDYYWTTAWTNYIANPTNTMAFNTVNDRLKALLKYLMNLAEYHLS